MSILYLGVFERVRVPGKLFEQDRTTHINLRYLLSTVVHERLLKLFPFIQNVWLFGSVALDSEHFRPSSDIDLLIEVPDERYKFPIKSFIKGINEPLTEWFNTAMETTGIGIAGLFDIEGKIVTTEEIFHKNGFGQIPHNIHEPPLRLTAPQNKAISASL